MGKIVRLKEKVIVKLIFISGYSAVFFSLAIFYYILRESIPFFQHYSWWEFFTGAQWYPVSEPPKFGILPLLSGSFIVAFFASLITIPAGLIVAVYISEIAPLWVRSFLKSSLEILVGIPTVILGVVALYTLVPFLRTLFNIPTGLTALAGALMLSLMAIPTMASMSEDCLSSIHPQLKENSLALGATHWQTIKYILIPSARSGIIAAALLSVGRVMGETMVVLMITGNAPQVTLSLLKPVRVLTATIGAEMGEAVIGSAHYHALFTLGLVLLTFSTIINVTSYFLVSRKK